MYHPTLYAASWKHLLTGRVGHQYHTIIIFYENNVLFMQVICKHTKYIRILENSAAPLTLKAITLIY